VVDDMVKQCLNNWGKISWQEIQNGSVQIWGTRIDSLRVPQFERYPNLYEWNLAYDDFIGYMAGVLQVEEFAAKGGAVL
jgi:CRISPR-associated endonuclease/helicase Cas3